jgi:hypothetical protein
LFALSDLNELPAAMAAMKRDGFDGLTHLSDGGVYDVCMGRLLALRLTMS